MQALSTLSQSTSSRRHTASPKEPLGGAGLGTGGYSGMLTLLREGEEVPPFQEPLALHVACN